MQRINYIYFFTLISLLSACVYPYHTPQARRARTQAKKAQKIEKQVFAKDFVANLDTFLTTIEPKVENDKIQIFKPKIAINDSSKVDSPSTRPNKMSKLNKISNDSSQIIIDSTKNSLDSNKIEADSSLLDTIFPRPAYIQFSPDSLDAEVNYEARDSMIYELSERKIYLYGKAEVVYKDYKLTAGKIIIDLVSSLATAEGIIDSNEVETERPTFKDATQEFTAKKIEFNFKSKKGKVYEASTKQGDGFFLSEVTKFISRNDSTAQDGDIIYSENCLYTTCNHRYPHFGIRGTKAKVIPNKLIVLGPSYLEIMATPTPLVLPFAFFPLNQKNNRSSGLIFSSNIEFSPTFGAGLRGMGYYFRFSDHVDLALTTDVYMRGSFRVYAESNYNMRYNFKGNLKFGYSRLIFDQQGTPDYRVQPDFNINWVYNQDVKAHPSRTFSASVNFGTANYFRNNTNSASQVLQGTFQSQVSLSQRLSKNLTFIISASHSQNTATRMMNLNLPSSQLRLNNISPFKRKVGSGDKWYEQIKFAYNVSFDNKISIYDSLLFAPEGLQRLLDTMDYTIKHQPQLTLNLKLFKYINVQPQLQYSETWVFQSKERVFNNSLFITPDTTFNTEDSTIIDKIEFDTTFGKVETSKARGFHQIRDMSAGVSMNTQIYAFTNFALGRLHRIRAVFRPDVGFRWRPDYQSEFWNYYQELITDSRYPTRTQFFRRYDAAPGGGKSALITYALSTRIDAKWRKSAADTSKERFRNIILLNNVALSGNYNIAADSFQWSVVSMNANATLLKMITLTTNFSFDPYAADKNTDRRLQALEWNENGRLARLTNCNFAASTALNNGSWAEISKLLGRKTSTEPTPAKSGNNTAFLQALTLNYNLSVAFKYANGKDTTIYTSNELSLMGTFNFSKNWNMRIGRIGYDFSRKTLTYPDFTFSRNLHCWEMGVQWYPAPERRTWSFFLKVRPGSLGFINVPYRKSVQDPY